MELFTTREVCNFFNKIAQEKRDKKEASPVVKENEEVVEQVKGSMARRTQ